MADEEINETTEETLEAEAPAEETPVAEAPAEEAPAEEAPAEEAPAEETPAVEEAPEPVAQTEEPAAADAPVEQLAPKERRHRARAAKAAQVPPRDPRSAEERQAERKATRRKKAEVRRGVRVKTRAKARGGSAEATPAREHIPGVQKVRQGIVVSDKAPKTITVRIDTARRHRRYEKIVRTSRTLHAHDERSEANIGDTVIVREARPLSRTKRWRLVRVVEKAR
jgi:small subunit ribosomal protein S17